MKNAKGARPVTVLPIGPRPSRATRPLSEALSAILEQLRALDEPPTLAALSQASGLHINTVRGHLETLLGRGLVTREAAEIVGRGRPAWIYQATEIDPLTSEYSGLASALAGSIARNSAHPVKDAVIAGEDWGRELARHRSGDQSSLDTPVDARERVVALLETVGFETERGREPSNVHLTRCPLLDAARRNPEVVCAVHLGIVRGALETYGASPRGTALVQFALPGACQLTVPPLPLASA